MCPFSLFLACIHASLIMRFSRTRVIFFSNSPFFYIILNAGDTKQIFIARLYRENNKFDKTVLSIKLYHEV